MKKLISLILALVLMTGMLAACAPSNMDGTEANLQTAPPEASTQDTEVTEPTDSTEETTEPVDASDPTEPEQETTEGTEPTQAETTKPTEKPTEPTQPSTTKPTEKPTQPTKPTQPSHTHSYTSTKVAATCTKGGYTLHKCSCGKSYTDSETAALGHSWGNWTVVTQPTTQQEGKQTRTCSRCGATESQSIPKVEAPALEWSDLDLNKAAAVGNQYAASKYGCIPDTSLNVNTPYVGYNFPISYGRGELMSYVPDFGNTYQEALEFAVRDNVDLFVQSVISSGRGDNVEGAFVNCWCVIQNNLLWIYVFYQ